MGQLKTDIIVIKKSRFFYAVIAIVFFLIGFFGTGMIKLPGSTNQKAVENCKKFCEFIPDTEFSNVDANSHCFCIQKNQRIFDRLLNKTLVYTKIVDAGIVTDVEIKDFIEQVR